MIDGCSIADDITYAYPINLEGISLSHATLITYINHAYQRPFIN